MGQGEYGGNGSVHYYGIHRQDRNHGHSPHSYHEVDECPAKGGSFTVQIFGVGEADFKSPNGIITLVSGTLTVTVPIVHRDDYARQILITWPDCEGKPEGMAASAAKTGGRSAAV